MSAGPLVICDISIDLTGKSSGLISAWISNYNGYNVWVVEIAYPFSNFKGAVVEAWECNKSFNATLYSVIYYVPMLEL